MSKIRHLCLGVSALSLLILGTFSVQVDDAVAYSGCRNPHVIAAGENLSVIAAQYNVTVGDLIEENGITDPNVIVIGQTICIPNGGKKSSNSGGREPRYNDGWGDYAAPGESYDPSTIRREGGSSPEYYEPQQQSYGPQQQSYAPYEESYGPTQQYGSQQQSAPQQQRYSSYDGYGVPGKAYDPAVVYAQQPQSTRSTADREFDEEFEADPTPTAEPTMPPDNGQENGDGEENGDGG